MNCCNTKYKKLMEDFLYGRLNSEDTDTFQDHLLECADCRKIFLDECMLKEFTRKYRNQLVSEPVSDMLWNSLKTLLDTIEARFVVPAFPLNFRNGVATPVVRRVLYTINLTGKPDICPVHPLFAINGDTLKVDGIRTKCRTHEVYLMICSKNDLQSLKPAGSESVQSMISLMALKLAMNRSLDPGIENIIEKSIVFKGLIEAGNMNSDNENTAVFKLPELAVSYLLSSDSIPVVMLR